MVAIIDYDAGNLKSVQKAFQRLGEEAEITREFSAILRADRIVLPGVGSFGTAMEQIRRYELDRVIYEAIEKKLPFLGICLGLQLLFQGSEESGGIEGLGVLQGQILKIPEAEGLKIPHIGWNSLTLHRNGRLFHSIPDESYVYFVHSYYLQAARAEDVSATTSYVVDIHAAAERGNVFATQFHPEKSGEIGLRILQNFIGL